MDIGKAFTFVFEDDDWVVKVLIAMGILVAGLVLFWLVIPAILAGLLLSRLLARDHPQGHPRRR